MESAKQVSKEIDDAVNKLDLDGARKAASVLKILSTYWQARAMDNEAMMMRAVLVLTEVIPGESAKKELVNDLMEIIKRGSEESKKMNDIMDATGSQPTAAHMD